MITENEEPIINAKPKVIDEYGDKYYAYIGGDGE